MQIKLVGQNAIAVQTAVADGLIAGTWETYDLFEMKLGGARGTRFGNTIITRHAGHWEAGLVGGRVGETAKLLAQVRNHGRAR
jgi:hypothetical protein